MSKYLLTYKDAQEISEKYNNNNFWEINFMKEGYKLASFNYFICGWNDFNCPLPNKPEINAFDMRGTTFVFNKDGSLWKRFFMLPKFYNLNQVELTQYKNIKDKKILSVSQKEDGSLVAFMMLPNGKLFSKTIGSFTSEQAEAAYRILYTNEEHVIWIKYLLGKGYTPLFEYVSWENRVVLKYSTPQIRFIGVRDNTSGEYLTAAELTKETIPLGIQPVIEKVHTLDELLELASLVENKEGWVIKYDDFLVKCKTAWYFKLHGLRTENIFREDYVIKHYLNETLDDLMSMLNPNEDKDAFEFVKKVMTATNNFVAHVDESVDKLVDEYNSSFYFEHWAKFATDKHKEAFFGLARTKIENPINYHSKKVGTVLAMTSHLKQAKQIVETWK